MAQIGFEIPFDVSMLDAGEDVIIHCPEECLVEDLFEIFKEHELHWSSLEDIGITHWDRYRENTLYFVGGKRLTFGNANFKPHTQECGIKCTFYGAQGDATQIDEDEWLALLESSIDETEWRRV